MVTMNLDTDDIAFLRQHLARHAQHVENELARTDARSMQRDLARDLERIQTILTKLEPTSAAS